MGGIEAGCKFARKGGGGLKSKDQASEKEFSILPEGGCKPLGSLNSLLSNAPQLSGQILSLVYLAIVWSLSRVRLFATPWTVALPGSSVRGVLQARILEWVAVPSSRGSSQPRD